MTQEPTLRALLTDGKQFRYNDELFRMERFTEIWEGDDEKIGETWVAMVPADIEQLVKSQSRADQIKLLERLKMDEDSMGNDAWVTEARAGWGYAVMTFNERIDQETARLTGSGEK